MFISRGFARVPGDNPPTVGPTPSTAPSPSMQSLIGRLLRGQWMLQLAPQQRLAARCVSLDAAVPMWSYLEAASVHIDLLVSRALSTAAWLYRCGASMCSWQCGGNSKGICTSVSILTRWYLDTSVPVRAFLGASAHTIVACQTRPMRWYLDTTVPMRPFIEASVPTHRKFDSGVTMFLLPLLLDTSVRPSDG